MITIREMPEDDIDHFVAIIADSYPAMNIYSEEDFSRISEALRRPGRVRYGAYSDGALVGGMLYYAFQMNYHGLQVPAAGIGQVGVSPLRRKEKVAKELVTFFVQLCRDRGIPLATLYPFRPDFYKRMGFGFGTKMNHYRFRTSALPPGGRKDAVTFMSAGDLGDITACHNRYVAQHHGMMERDVDWMKRIVDRPRRRTAGFMTDEGLEGYVIYEYAEAVNWLSQDIRIIELIYQNSDALLGLSAFLRSQIDQVSWIVLNTLDDSWHHLLSDPRNGSDRVIPSVYHESNAQGVGLMYRVVDTGLCFNALEAHNFYGQTMRLGISVRDTFFPENGSTIVISFVDGRPGIDHEKEADVEISLDIADLSCLVMGVVGFKTLYDYGLAGISDVAYLAPVDRLFQSEKPICMTDF